MGIVLFFVIFVLVVLVHEFGHFIIAKANGIMVKEFCLGMGPVLVSFTKGGTKYAIRLLPLGGACIFEGEDGKYSDDADDGEKEDVFTEVSAKDDKTEGKNAEKTEGFVANAELDANGKPFPEANVWGRIATVFAGPFFNFLLAFLFSMIIIGSYGADMPIVVKVMEGGAAQEAGIQEGDRILKLDHHKIHLYREISLYSMLNKGEPMEITYSRDGQENVVTINPKYNEQAGRYYIGLLGQGIYEKTGFLKTASCSFYEVKYYINTVIKSLEMMVQGKMSKDDLAGPVGVAKMVDDVYTESKPDGVYYIFLNMLSFCILLSANLGVMNLLPLPALDGGRLIFLFLEVIRGKPIPPEKEGVVHLIGMVALMVLMAFIFVNDLTRFFR